MSAAGPWLALLFAVAGAVLVVRCVARGHTASGLRPLWLGLAMLAIAAPLWLFMRDPSSQSSRDVAKITQPSPPLSPEAAAAHAVIVHRCYACHSSQTSLMHAPYNLNLDVPGAIDRLAPRIYHQVVMLRAMPVGNATHMTEDERVVIARWYRARPAAEAAPGGAR